MKSDRQVVCCEERIGGEFVRVFQGNFGWDCEGQNLWGRMVLKKLDDGVRAATPEWKHVARPFVCNCTLTVASEFVEECRVRDDKFCGNERVGACSAVFAVRYAIQQVKMQLRHYLPLYVTAMHSASHNRKGITIRSFLCLKVTFTLDAERIMYYVDTTYTWQCSNYQVRLSHTRCFLCLYVRCLVIAFTRKCLHL